VRRIAHVVLILFACFGRASESVADCSLFGADSKISGERVLAFKEAMERECPAPGKSKSALSPGACSSSNGISEDFKSIEACVQTLQSASLLGPESRALELLLNVQFQTYISHVARLGHSTEGNSQSSREHVINRLRAQCLSPNAKSPLQPHRALQSRPGSPSTDQAARLLNHASLGANAFNSALDALLMEGKDQPIKALKYQVADLALLRLKHLKPYLTGCPLPKNISTKLLGTTLNPEKFVKKLFPKGELDNDKKGSTPHIDCGRLVEKYEEAANLVNQFPEYFENGTGVVDDYAKKDLFDRRDLLSKSKSDLLGANGYLWKLESEICNTLTQPAGALSVVLSDPRLAYKFFECDKKTDCRPDPKVCSMATSVDPKSYLTQLGVGYALPNHDFFHNRKFLGGGPDPRSEVLSCLQESHQAIKQRYEEELGQRFKASPGVKASTGIARVFKGALNNLKNLHVSDQEALLRSLGKLSGEQVSSYLSKINQVPCQPKHLETCVRGLEDLGDQIDFYAYNVNLDATVKKVASELRLPIVYRKSTDAAQAKQQRGFKTKEHEISGKSSTLEGLKGYIPIKAIFGKIGDRLRASQREFDAKCLTESSSEQQTEECLTILERIVAIEEDLAADEEKMTKILSRLGHKYKSVPRVRIGEDKSSEALVYNHESGQLGWVKYQSALPADTVFVLGEAETGKAITADTDLVLIGQRPGADLTLSHSNHYMTETSKRAFEALKSVWSDESESGTDIFQHGEETCWGLNPIDDEYVAYPYDGGEPKVFNLKLSNRDRENQLKLYAEWLRDQSKASGAQIIVPDLAFRKDVASKMKSSLSPEANEPEYSKIASIVSDGGGKVVQPKFQQGDAGELKSPPRPRRASLRSSSPARPGSPASPREVEALEGYRVERRKSLELTHPKPTTVKRTTSLPALPSVRESKETPPTKNKSLSPVEESNEKDGTAEKIKIK